MGGGRLFHLIYRLSLLPTLKDFIVSKNDCHEMRGFEGGTKLAAESQDRIIGITESGEPELERDINIYSNNLIQNTNMCMGKGQGYNDLKMDFMEWIMKIILNMKMV